MFREHRHIFHPLAKRRNLYLDRIYAVIKVLAKIAILDGLERIAIRRANESKIGFLRLVAADSIKHFFLQDAEQLWLQVDGHFADLVEQDTAAVCLTDKTHLIAISHP
jgi:hypothetical protein